MPLQILRVVALCFCISLIVSKSAYADSTEQQKEAYLKTHLIGQSRQGRDLELIEVKGSYATNLTVYINALHHGNETITYETALAITEELKRAVQNEETWLQGVRFLIQSQVNPDGYLASTRGDSKGRDINRAYLGKLETPENQAVDQVLKRFDIDAAIALHSGQRAILWPWAHQPVASKDEKKFRYLASKMASLSGIKKLTSSYHDYPTQGEFIDYAYERYGVLAFTYEISWQHELVGKEKSLIIQEVWMALRKLVEGLRRLEENTSVSH